MQTPSLNLTPSPTPAPAPARRLDALVADAIASAGGWIGFDRYMEMALYQPGLGYYANGLRKFGHLPGMGSDFVTAPELSPLFGRCVAFQVAEALAATGTQEIWEFGAGSGALARQVLTQLLPTLPQVRYTIIDLSGELRERQRATLGELATHVRWADSLPDRIEGVAIGNEVLDAMPVKLLARLGGVWHERGVRLAGPPAADGTAPLAWHDEPTTLRPPVEVAAGHDYITEIHPHAQAFMATLADRLARGAAFFIDYGFPEREYYHPQRHMGTLVCHRAHRVDHDPLSDLGLKDITAHVNFTAIALAAQEAGLPVLGYTTQARFLMNCGLLDLLSDTTATKPGTKPGTMPDSAATLDTVRLRANAQKLLTEHEMGELFKVIGFVARDSLAAYHEAIGFSEGDRSHAL